MSCHTITDSHKSTQKISFVQLALVLGLTFSLLLVVLFPRSAFADIRNSDIILGQTIEARGLPGTQCPSIDCEYALVVGADGTIYFERNATQTARIASMTKIMTAIVAIEYCPLDQIVYVDREAAQVGESSASLREGDSMPLGVALLALMVPSGNDAAIAIAKTVGAYVDPNAEDPEAVFVGLMNKKAQELGCFDTVFENPHGLDINEFDGDLHSSAADMGRIVVYAMGLDEFRQVVGAGDTTITVASANGTEKDIELKATDELIGVYEGVCGVKTGYTESAGYCFAGAVNRDGQEFYSIVMNAPSSNQRFTDTTTLMDWVFNHHVDYPLAHSSQTTSMVIEGEQQEVPVVAYVAHTGWIDVVVPGALADPFQSVKVFDLSGNIIQDVELYELSDDVYAGDQIGSITFTQRGNVVAEVPIVATQDVLAPSLWEGIGIWWDRLFRGFSGEQKVAESTVVNETPFLIDKTSE